MFDVAPTELLLVAVVALIVIGPKDLPRAMRFVGNWIAKARGVARHFRSGLDEMVRQADLEEMEKKWAAENERIMREHAQEMAQAGIDTGMIPLGGPADDPAPAEAAVAPSSEPNGSEPAPSEPAPPQPISPKRLPEPPSP